MPLREGKSKDVISENISELVKAGWPRSRAVAISLKKAANSKGVSTMAKKKKKTKHKSPKRVAAGKKAARTRKRNAAKKR